MTELTKEALSSAIRSAAVKAASTDERRVLNYAAGEIERQGGEIERLKCDMRELTETMNRARRTAKDLAEENHSLRNPAPEITAQLESLKYVRVEPNGWTCSTLPHGRVTDDVAESWNAAIDAVKLITDELVAELRGQEPVAWQFNWHKEGWMQCKNKREYDEIINNGNKNFEVRELYARPVPPASTWTAGSEPKEFGKYYVRYLDDDGREHFTIAEWMRYNFCAGSDTNIHNIWMDDRSRSISAMTGVTHFIALPVFGRPVPPAASQPGSFEVEKAVWDALNRQACPPAWMRIAANAVLQAFCNDSRPTRQGLGGDAKYRLDMASKAHEASQPCFAAAPQPDHFRGVTKLVSAAVRDVIAERQRQITAEGWTPEHDDEHVAFEMSFAAATYVLHIAQSYGGQPYKHVAPSEVWPWDLKWLKFAPGPRRSLVKAAALILAEIDRLDRAAPQSKGGEA
ncbi:hypothetical protein [Dickeya fangzhongdai]|uniref:hypothetical protein n=1 Tax=Dickeya fangzhongdai TaxID=1778540 RepID=UPI0023E4532D|nr:hypothetical protein [Dickeya fangzhongdai]WES88805.1 hypothetical protein PQ617_21800 [Dickeya fangzhongdai]